MPTSDTALVFTVAGARLGLRVTQVSEVLPVAELNQVPETPHVVGRWCGTSSAARARASNR